MHRLRKLQNGLRLITIPMRGTKTATVLVMVRTGSKYEDKKNNGISHFLEHMFFKGTIKRPNTLAIASELDKIGADFNAFTGKEYTGYWVKTESGQIELALDVVSDMLLNSKFDAQEIEREKGVIIEEFNMYRDNPMMYIEDLFEELLYGDQPAGWDTIGTRKNILGFSRKDFVDYFNSQYGAQNTFVCLAGNIKNENSLIKKYFNNLKQSDFKNKLETKEKQDKPEIKLHYKKTDQVHLSLGVRAYLYGHKDEFALKILGIILGGSMSSRLFTELRERQGLAYSVRTQAEFYTDSGYLATQAGVPIKKVDQAIKIILSEYNKIKDKKINIKELERTKSLLKGKMALQLESSDNMASWHCRSAILRDKILTPEEFLKKINKVRVSDIKRVAEDIFVNEKLNLAIIGPFRDKKKFKLSL
ncbi:MAG: pitrilysin family protein [Candidatus Falkowbacteria bacterium]